MTPVPTSFLHGNAALAVLPDLQQVVADSVRFDAVVAFVTRAGVDLFHDAIQSLSGAASLTASVRWPTDLRKLAAVAEQFPGSVFIHTMHARVGDSPPQELLHSKLVLSRRDDGDVDVVVGSHNWTGKALGGVNREASLSTRLAARDPRVPQVQQHIQQCQAECVALSMANLDELLGLQAALGGAGSGSTVPGVHNWKATVIHAEAVDDALRDQDELLVYVSPNDRAGLLDKFAVGRKVDLWLYEVGTLHGHAPPASVPVLFRGKSDMLNVASSGAVTSRTVHQQLHNLNAPTLDWTRGVPVKGHPTIQVVLRLSRVGEREPLLYGKGHRPKLVSTIEEEPVEGLSREGWDPMLANLVVVFEPVLREVETSFRVPSHRRLYPDAVGQRLSARVSDHTRKKLKRATKSQLVEAKLQKGDSPFFYQSSHIIDVDEP